MGGGDDVAVDDDLEERGGLAPLPPDVPTEVDTLRGQPLDLSPSTEVGTLPGSASVDASGQANYSIPLAVPPGVPGMTPEIAVTYDSDRGNGTLGVGFGLSGQSSLRRCTESILDDGAWAPVRWTDDDALCLDGDRLVLETGVHGKDASKYRLAHDPTRRVVLHEDISELASWFEVFESDGRIGKYGTPVGSLWRGTNTSDAKPYVWALVERRDRFANLVTYVHSMQSFTETGPGHLRLDEIRYAGSGALSTFRRVRLQYVPRVDVLDTWFFGAHQRVTALLDTIVVESLGELQHTYTFDYELGVGGRNQLTSLQICDREEACLPPTTFEWSPQQTVEWSREDVVNEHTTFFLNDLGSAETQEILLNSPHTMLVDIDGNLDQEMVFRADGDALQPWYVWNGDDDYEDVVHTMAATVPPTTNDGLDDLVAWGIGGLSPSVGDVMAWYLPQFQPALSASVLAFDGDRRNDILLPRRPVPFTDLVLDDAGHPYADGLNVGLGHAIDDVVMVDVSEYSTDHIYSVVPLDHDGDQAVDAWLCRGPGYKSGRWTLAHNSGAQPYDFEYLATDVGCSVHDELLVVPTRGGGQRLFVVPAYETDLASMPVPADFGDVSKYVADYPPTPDDERNSYFALHFDLETDESWLEPTSLPRDRYQRWHDVRCRNGVADTYAGAPLFGAGIGQDKLVDVNSDGFVDVLRFELEDGDTLAQQGSIATGLPATWPESFSQTQDETWLEADQCDASIDTIEGSGIRVWWNTGESFVSGDFVHTFDGQAHTNYWVNFVGAQPIDADDDGRTDLLLPATGHEGSSWTLLRSRMDGTFTAEPAAVAEGWPAYAGEAEWAETLARSRSARIIAFQSEPQERARLAFIGYVPEELAGDEEWIGAINVWKTGSTSAVSGRVVAIHDGLGKEVTFEYDAIDVSSVAEGPSPTVPLGVPLFVTTRMCAQTRSLPFVDEADTLEPDTGGTAICTSYEYLDARVDRWGRGMLGFAEIRAAAPAAATYRVTRYSQEFDEALVDYPTAGRPVEEIVWHIVEDADGAAPRMHADRTTWTYDWITTALAGGSSTYVHVETDHSLGYSAWASDCPADDRCDEALDDVFPYRDTLVTDVRDSLGTLMSRTSKTVNGETTTWTASMIGHDMASWLLGQVKRVDETNCSRLGDCKARAVTFAYDAVKGVVTQSVQMPGDVALQLTTAVLRDAHGNVRKTTATPIAAPARITETLWDPAGVHPLSFENALGQFSYAVHDPASGLLLAEVDVAGATMKYQYDGFGRETYRVRHATPMGVSDGGWVTTDYLTPDPTEPESRMRVRTRDAQGQRVTTHVDATDRPVLRTWWGMAEIGAAVPQAIPPGVEVFQRFRYAQTGYERDVSVPQWWLQPIPGWTRTDLDPLGRHMQTRAPDGHVVATTTYSHSGALFDSTQVSVTDGDGHTTRTGYDSDGYTLETVDAAGTSTCFRPGAWGKTLTVRRNCGPQSGSKHVTTRTYDALGHMKTEQDSVFATRTLTWNAFGELVSVKDGKNQTTTYQPDPLGRVQSITDPSGVTSFTWDTVRKGKLTQATTPAGVVDSYEYDTFGRTTRAHQIVASTSGADDYVFEYVWGPGDRLLQMNYPSVDGEPTFSVGLKYDDAGHLRALQNPANGSAYWVARRANARTQLELENFTNGVTTTRVWHEQRGWPESIVTTRPAALDALQSLHYEWTPDGELSKRRDDTLAGNQYETFGYDELHRLTSAQVTRNKTAAAPTTVTYDRSGNIRTKSDAGPYAYDIAGILVTADGQGVFHDANGNIVSAGARTFAYTPFDKIRTATTGGVTTTMRYDATQSRVLRSHPVEGDTVSVGQLYERKVAPGGATQSITYRLVADGRVVTQVVKTPAWTTKTYSVHDDHLGSTNVVTASAAVTDRIAYDAWGRARNATDWTKTAMDSDAAKVGVGYTGHRATLDTELIDMGGRMYDPKIARFTSVDPIVADPLDGQSWNRYAYVGNRPLVATDPSGFRPAKDDGLEFGHDFVDEDGVRGRWINVPAPGSDEPNGSADAGIVGYRPTGMEGSGLGLSSDVGGTMSTIRSAQGVWVRGPNRLVFVRDTEARDAQIWAQVHAKRNQKLDNLIAFGGLFDSATEVTLHYGSYVSPVIAAIDTGIRVGDAVATGDSEAMGDLVIEAAVDIAAKAIKLPGSIHNRPTKFRKGTERSSWDNAADGPSGGKLCPGCGVEVHIPPGQGTRAKPRDWHVDHEPAWSKRPKTQTTRREVLDDYNRETGMLCVACNLTKGNK